MEKSGIIGLLDDMGAIVNGHFVYRSGRHGKVYVNKDMLYTNPYAVSDACEVMAKDFFSECIVLHLNEAIEYAVVSPAVGGVALSQWTTYHLLNRSVPVVALYADKTEGVGLGGKPGFIIKRGYENLVPGRKVLVVEDILTKGDSARDTIAAVRAAGGDVVMAVAICNRGKVTAEQIGTPILRSLLYMDLEDYDPKDCPLCKNNVAISTSLGHGAKKS